MVYSFLQPLFNYLIRVGDAASQLLNVLVFFGDNPNESISGRAWRLHKSSKFWKLMKICIDYIASPLELGHCEASHKADVSRAARLLRNQG